MFRVLHAHLRMQPYFHAHPMSKCQVKDRKPVGARLLPAATAPPSTKVTGTVVPSSAV